MLSVMILATLTLSPDDAPRPSGKPVAMVLDLDGKVVIRPAVGKARPAESGDLLYPGEVLIVPTRGAATVAILGVGTQEILRPGVEATIGVQGCTPEATVASRKHQVKSVATTMRGLRPAPSDGRKAGFALRSGPGDRFPSFVIAPIDGATITSDRPAMAWPASEGPRACQVTLRTSAGRELWRAETTEAALGFPDSSGPLESGLSYRWEAVDREGRRVAGGEFRVATASARGQIEELLELASRGDRADRLGAAMALQRLGALAESIAVHERIVREAPSSRSSRLALAELYRAAGRLEDAERLESGSPRAVGEPQEDRRIRPRLRVR